MTETKAALHEAVDQLEEAEAEAMLAAIRAKRMDAFLSNVEEVEPDEWDREMLASIADEDRDPTTWISSEEVKARLGILESR